MEHSYPYLAMSQPSPNKRPDPYNHGSYNDHQDMMLSNDGEDATLAEPMTLEGAKHLARSSPVIVAATTPTPPAPSPPQSRLPPRLSSPHHHYLHPPLVSPPVHHHPSLSTVAPHLTPPTPPPHSASHLHHQLWPPSSVSHNDDDEDEDDHRDLPSTVDIQAIRDSPSPDPNSGKLVTIDENWDSLEDNNQVVNENQDEEDEEEEEEEVEDESEEDSDSDSTDSDANSRNSSVSDASVKSSRKSRSVSKSPCDSRSNSESQDSESDSSGCSDSDGNSTSSESEDNEESIRMKPLPRRKPQLTAPIPRPSKPTPPTPSLNTYSSKESLCEIDKNLEYGSFGSKSPEDQNSYSLKSASDSDLVNDPKENLSSGKYTQNTPSDNEKESERSMPSLLSDNLIEDHKLKDKETVPVFSVVDCSKANRPIHSSIVSIDLKSNRVELPKLDKSFQNKLDLNKSKTLENQSSKVKGAEKNELSKSEHSSAISDSLPLTVSKNEKDSPVKVNTESKPIAPVPPVDLEVRRREKKLELDRVFDRLLHSSKSEEKEYPPKSKSESDRLNSESEHLSDKTKHKYSDKCKVNSDKDKSSKHNSSSDRKSKRDSSEHEKSSKSISKSRETTSSKVNDSNNDSFGIDRILQKPYESKKSIEKSNHSSNGIISKESSHKSDSSSKKSTTTENHSKSKSSYHKEEYKHKSEKHSSKNHDIKSSSESKYSHKSESKSHSDSRHSDSRHSDSRHTDSRHSDSRHSDSRHSDSRHSDSRHSDSRHSDSRHSDSKHSDSKHSDSKHSDSKHSDSKHSDSKHSESRHSDTKSHDSKSRSDSKSHSDSKSRSDSKYSDSKSPSDSKSRSDSKYSDSKSRSEIRHSESKSHSESKKHSKDTESSKTKEKEQKSISHKPFEGIRPTIADLVKVRERRRSLEKDQNLSGNERKRSNLSDYKEESSSDSESSIDLNEKVDLDTEQTQKFSVSESNFNQGRLTMKIAAMKMAKFGRTGLREVTTGVLPTRGDHANGFSAFKRPRPLPPKHNSSMSETHKVKTAAERKTYADSILAGTSNSRSSSESRHKKTSSSHKGNMKLSSVFKCNDGASGSGLNYNSSSGGAFNLHSPSSCSSSSRSPGGTVEDEEEEEEEEEEIFSRLVDLSQITSNPSDHSLQVLDQEVLDVLPEVTDGVSTGERSTLDSLSVDETESREDSDTDEDVSNLEDEDGGLTDTINSILNLPGNNSSSPECQTEHFDAPSLSKYDSFRSPGNLAKHKDDHGESRRKNRHQYSAKDNGHDDGLDPNLPELESYPDCIVSNVSPDSGIQSVNGSPLHHVGSPAQHHSPFYASSTGSSFGGIKPVDSCASGLSRSYSPSLSSQNSPPPPVLLPAISGLSPVYDEDAPNSPPMPSLEPQVELPIGSWRPEASAKQNILEEQGTYKVRGPGRPNIEKPKRSRGRPRGSKKKKLSDKSNVEDNDEPLDDAEDLNPENDEKNSSNKNEFSDKFKYPSSCNWRDSEVVEPIRKGPGRPKKKHVDTDAGLKIKSVENNEAPEVQNSLSNEEPDKCDENYEDTPKKKHKNKKSSKTKKSVGRPRKNIPGDLSDNIPTTAASKKCFSERIMHKIVNEKVRNSEKSDKLSVHNDPSSVEKDPGDPYVFGDTGSSNLSQPYLWEKRKKNKGKGVRLSSDGIPLNESRRRRGRKMILPAIFQKVYGDVDKKSKKSDMPKISCESTTTATTAPAMATPTATAPVVKQSHKKKKKKAKQFKSKHKNIIDPVFQAELDKLNELMQLCAIGKLNTNLSPKSGSAALPSIFRLQEINPPITKKRRGSEKPKTSDRESGPEGESNKERAAGKRKKKAQEIPKQGKECSDANEQRLPLKKRHRHISTAVPSSNVEEPKAETEKAPVDTPKTKDISLPEEKPIQVTPNNTKKNESKEQEKIKPSKDMSIIDIAPKNDVKINIEASVQKEGNSANNVETSSVITTNSNYMNQTKVESTSRKETKETPVQKSPKKEFKIDKNLNSRKLSEQEIIRSITPKKRQRFDSVTINRIIEDYENEHKPPNDIHCFTSTANKGKEPIKESKETSIKVTVGLTKYPNEPENIELSSKSIESKVKTKEHRTESRLRNSTREHKESKNDEVKSQETKSVNVDNFLKPLQPVESNNSSKILDIKPPKVIKPTENLLNENELKPPGKLSEIRPVEVKSLSKIGSKSTIEVDTKSKSKITNLSSSDNSKQTSKASEHKSKSSDVKPNKVPEKQKTTDVKSSRSSESKRLCENLEISSKSKTSESKTRSSTSPSKGSGSKSERNQEIKPSKSRESKSKTSDPKSKTETRQDSKILKSSEKESKNDIPKIERDSPNKGQETRSKTRSPNKNSTNEKPSVNVDLPSPDEISKCKILKDSVSEPKKIDFLKDEVGKPTETVPTAETIQNKDQKLPDEADVPSNNKDVAETSISSPEKSPTKSVDTKELMIKIIETRSQRHYSKDYLLREAARLKENKEAPNEGKVKDYKSDINEHNLKDVSITIVDLKSQKLSGDKALKDIIQSAEKSMENSEGNAKSLTSTEDKQQEKKDIVNYTTTQHSNLQSKESNEILKDAKIGVPTNENDKSAVAEADKNDKYESNTGSHSDSDIPSEHEPLYESDQSGFMSDKEEPKEIPKKTPLKRRKKKRELRSPIPNVACKVTQEEETIENEPIPCKKKKVKRRKTNRTGFPTIRKKKKKPKPADENSVESSCLDTNKSDTQVVYQKTSTNNNDQEQSCNFNKCNDDVDVNIMPEDKNSNENALKSDLANPDPADDSTEMLRPRSRGRPKKDIIVPAASQKSTDSKSLKLNEECPVKSLKETLRERKPKAPENQNPEENVDQEEFLGQENPDKIETAISSRTRKKRELSEDSVKAGTSDVKRIRKIEDDIEDSDTNMISESVPSSEPASSDESSRILLGKKKVPRWKKKYLVAGLFSNFYKEEDPGARNKKNGEVHQPKNKLTYDPEEHIHGLLPPPCYCRKWLRERQVDFNLPYDLWWLHVHNMLPGRDVVPSWNYKKVKSNIYYDVKPNHDYEIQACNCKLDKNKTGLYGCGDDCINRMMFIECSQQTCPIADVCSNRRLQRHEALNCLQRFMTPNKGWGVKATVDIKGGTFILEYVGEVVSEREFKHRMQTKYSNDKHHYCLNLDRGMVIDGHRMGGDCRFVNHSCNPNCEMQKWYVNGQYRMALFALKDIEQSEELTYDYNFSLFNPAEGQTCKCGSENCRGVIGGRSQRVNGLMEERKKLANRAKKELCRKRKRAESETTNCIAKMPANCIKPLSHQQRLFILAHRCFLIRNLEKVRRSRDRPTRVSEKKVEEVVEEPEEPTNRVEKFLTHFTALNTARSVKTRRLARAEDDPEMTRVAKLAQIFKDIYDKLVASRDDKDKPLATPFMSLPSKKKYPNYYHRVGEPIDLATIEKNIMTGHYISADIFDRDIMRLFANNLRFFGRNTEVGQMAIGLRKVYSECKLQFKPLLEEVLGEDGLPQAFANCSINEEFEDEDVIRCVCNLNRDEGMMIQCERCLVWQHCDCMGIKENDQIDNYLCEECSPRLVSPEVPMFPQPADAAMDHKYFITLLRDNLQVKQGDSVYILRDRPAQKSSDRRIPAYKLVKDVKTHELLVFKIENLWIDQKGDKFAFGYHYLRPHETFHEPWRKFFPNEVIRSPLCEILPLDMVVNHCWVLDLNTYCRGRPIGALEDHVYVCEYRVDKAARVFSKISKPKYPICTKPFAFITFPEKLRPQRTYTPHEVISSGRGRGSGKCNSGDPGISTTVLKPIKPTAEPVTSSTSITNGPSTLPTSSISTSTATTTSSQTTSEITSTSTTTTTSTSTTTTAVATASIPTNRKSSRSSSRSLERNNVVTVPIKEDPKVTSANREKKRLRINNVASVLLTKLPAKGAVDLSFLLENNKRQRKKTAAFAS